MMVETYHSWYQDVVMLLTRTTDLTAREASEMLADFYARERRALQAAFARE